MESFDHNQSLRERDAGRSQRGLLVIAGCILVWAMALWLGLRLIY